MQARTDWARNVATGAPAGSATVRVKISGTNTDADLYSDNGVTPKANPFVAAAITGIYTYYAPNGLYDETVTPLSGEGDPYTTPALVFGDPAAFGTFYVTDYGATGDGSTDDRAAIQRAIDAASVAGGIVYFPFGTYRVGRVSGTNDRWGLKVVADNVTFDGDSGATLRRYDSIVLAADAYPILFVGTPDSNVAAMTQNTQVRNLTFQGENVRHASSGQAVHDLRDAIEVKNSRGFVTDNCRFTAIDSSAIFFQQPATFDVATGVYYNTTKSHEATIRNCRFLATAHAIPGRALLHAIVPQGVDDCVISGNYFEWCDDCVANEGTYDDVNDVETDLYASGTVVGNVMRVGRGLLIENNRVMNSSEHALYPGGMDVVIRGNVIRVTNPTVCNDVQVKLRTRCCTVVSNVISAAIAGVAITEPSFQVVVAGNTITPQGTTSAAQINITSNSLTSYIDARPWLSTYYPMSNLAITGNVVQLPTAAEGNTEGAGVRVFTSNSAPAYPEGEVVGLAITGNTFRNVNIGVAAIEPLARNVRISGNTFVGKPFTSASFMAAQQLITASSAADDTLTCAAHGLSVNDAVWIDNTVALTVTSTGVGTQLITGGVYYVTAVPTAGTFKVALFKSGTVVNITNNGTGAFRKLNALSSFALLTGNTTDAFSGGSWTISDNQCIGFRYIVASSSAAGFGHALPNGMMNNQFAYFYTAFHASYAEAVPPKTFAGNTGLSFIDRTWRTTWTLFNSLQSGVGTSEYNSMLALIGAADVRLYDDDAGGYVQLG